MTRRARAARPVHRVGVSPVGARTVVVPRAVALRAAALRVAALRVAAHPLQTLAERPVQVARLVKAAWVGLHQSGPAAKTSRAGPSAKSSRFRAPTSETASPCP